MKRDTNHRRETMTTLTCYVDHDGDLLTYDTAERIRRATPAERAESYAEEPTGAFTAEVSERTLARRCPILMRQIADEVRCPE
jgi:hypothetical protein